MPDKLNRRIASERDWIASEARTLLRESATDIQPAAFDPPRSLTTGASQRFVIVGITRRSAGDKFEELRLTQVERLGNRPSPVLFARHMPQLAGTIPLATCCRFELHAILTEEEATTATWEETKESLTRGFAALLGHDPDDDDSPAHGRLAFYRGDEAIEHLIYMAAGGLSVLPGETEILSQLKAAYRWAIEDGQLDEARELHYIYQRAFHHTHRLHEIFFRGGGWSVSLPRLAMQRLGAWYAETDGSQLPSCEKLQVGFVGAGQVAGQLGHYAVREGYRPDQLTFYVRNKERALSRGYLPDGVKLLPVSELVVDLAAGRLNGLFGAVTHPLNISGPLQAALNDAGPGNIQPLPIIDLSVPAMLGRAEREAMPAEIKYISFEELVTERDRQNERRLGQLRRLRDEARMLARQMAGRLDRNAALRGEPLEQLRQSIADEAEVRFRHRLDRILREMDGPASLAGVAAAGQARRHRRIRSKLLGAFRHELMQAAKDYLLIKEQ